MLVDKIKDLTTKDLIALLFPVKDERPVEETTRYALYARKSSDDEKKQVKSIEDQIAECLEKAKSLGLNIVGAPLFEKGSAKIPDNRPVFTTMLKDIRKGEYTGILAWHPDRLSRNMREAGEVIDMLDTGVIKDLKFVSFSFENNPSGKMLLGITFVMSKEYSDKLSQDVMRGNTRRVVEGKTLNVAKYGYYRDKDCWQIPDESNFDKMKKAWVMRLEGLPLEVIANKLNELKVTLARKKERANISEVKFNKKNLSVMFRDPFYAGVFKHGNDLYADLIEQQSNFVPMVSVDDFVKINLERLRENKGYRSLVRVRDKPKADMARGIIICGYCNEAYHSGITTRKKGGKVVGRRYFYRCENPACPKTKNRSERAKYIVTGAHAILKDIKIKVEKAVYGHYKDEMVRVIALKNKELETHRRGLQKAKENQEKRLADIKQLILDTSKTENSEVIKQSYAKDLKETDEQIKKIERDLANISEAKIENKEVVLSYEKFLEHFKNLASRLEGRPTMEEIDFTIRKIFSNIVIKDHEVLSYQLNSPFKEFEEKGFVSFGRSNRTRTCDLTLPKRAL